MEKTSNHNKIKTFFARASVRKIIRKIFIYLILLTGVVIFSIPFYWLVISSLRTTSDIFTFPINWIPNSFVWENYRDVFAKVDFTRYIVNTLIITIGATAGVLLSSSMAAFGFSRIEFKGRELIFVAILTGMMVPMQVIQIPLYIIFRNLGWLDTFKPLIIPHWFGTPFFIFLLRQFFMGIPKSMEEAALIDGCNIFGVFWRIFVPMSKPAFTAVIIFSFMNNWNEFFAPLIYINQHKLFPLALGLLQFQDTNTTQWNLLLAATVMTIIPCILIFFIFQRYFIEGIQMQGLKG